MADASVEYCLFSKRFGGANRRRRARGRAWLHRLWLEPYMVDYVHPVCAEIAALAEARAS